MRKLQAQGIHHLTFIGADRQTSIDFWEGILGMPFLFEQPNLDAPDESHLYFDPGDGRLITVFTNENRRPDPNPTPESIGSLQHLAINVSRATYTQAKKRLDERGIKNSGEIDRGFMYSIYFRGPLGHLFELAAYKFEPPTGCTHADVLRLSHQLRVERDDYAIGDEHIADALEILARENTHSLSEDRTPKDPFAKREKAAESGNGQPDPRGLS